MADLDPTSVPFVMPATVQRTTPQGFPTKYLLNWEQASQAWFVNTTVDLQTKITTVEAAVGDVAASVVVETNARVSADEALAEQITTVDAKADNATASGQIYFAAKAGPTGSSASYGMYLTAGSAFAGFEALALSGGGSAIGLTANQFRFTDSGTAVALLDYSGGTWTFNSNVAINGGFILNGTVVTAGIAANAVSTTSQANVSSNELTLNFYARSGASVLLIGYFEASETGSGATLAYMSVNGSTVRSIPLLTVKTQESGDSGSVVTTILSTQIIYLYIPSYTGTHTAVLGTDISVAPDQIPKSLIAQELVR